LYKLQLPYFLFIFVAVVIVAVAVAIVPLIAHAHGIKHWLYLALVLLVIACPCALVISTPIATTCAIAQAARTGLVIKGGKHLEALGKIKVLAMDKTGTLTEGFFQVIEMQPLNDRVDTQKLLHW
jgi:Cd2+/Zn2+-exporting ATPase